MIPVAPDMKVDTESATTKKAQDGVLEFLLINHPLDCPVCDKGGECPLQDNAYAYGPGESRFVEEKRHFEKPIPISDLVFLDRERCILCDRCTRFAKEVAGDPLISFINRGNQTEVNTFPDDPFASYFSGNTVQICPVGALTAKPFRFKARPWDLEKVESTCTVCAVGCRTTVEASRNHVLRYQGIDIDPVNWGWLCDKGRFSFESIDQDDRVAEPLVRKRDELIGASWSEAFAAAGDALSKAEPGAVGVLGGARLTNEAAYAWAKLAKGVIGTDNVDCQLGDGLPADIVVSLPAATIDDVCAKGGTVVVLSGDLKEELPVLFLRLRDAIVNRGVKVIELGPCETGLTHLAAASLRHRPGDAHAAMAALLGTDDGTESVRGGDLEAARRLLSGTITAIVGRASVADTSASTVEAAAALLDAHPATRFLVALRRGNVRGAIDMGLAPGLLPGRVGLDEGREWYSPAWDKVPESAGLDATGILTAAAGGRLDVLVLLGADPLADFPDRDLAQRALAGARTVIAVDTYLNDSSRQADVVLAAAGYAETGGTTTNIEGRISELAQKVTSPGTARDDWMIAAELAYRLDADLGLESVEGIWDEVERLAPSHAGITSRVLRSFAAQDGVVAPIRPEVAAAADGTPVAINGVVKADSTEGTIAPAPQAEAEPAPEAEAEPEAAAAAEPAADAEDEHDAEPAPEPEPEPSGPARPEPMAYTRPPTYTAPPLDGYSLRLAATRRLYDAGTMLRHAPSMAALAPGATLHVNPTDLERLGLSGGDRVKVSSSRASFTTEAHADERLPKGVASLTVNQLEGPNPHELIDASLPVTDIRVETV
jgi:NADH-quinone oxidoreductase subunit G